MIRVLVADDHPVVRRGLVKIIEETSDIVVAGEAGSGQEVLNKLKQNQYDLLLLDISMPDQDGIQVMEYIGKTYSDLPVLVLTIHPEKNYAIRMFRAGALGYLTKEKAPYELIEAIRQVARKGKYVSPTFATALDFHSNRGSVRPLHEVLSKREFQIMCMIAGGKTVSKIARELSLSVKTVSTHRSHILEKMNMKNNSEIIRYAVENKL